MMEESRQFSSQDYFRNLLSLLDLKVFGCLGACGEESRGEAHDLLADLAEFPRRDAFVPTASESEALARLLDALMKQRSAILSDFASWDNVPSFEKLCDRFGLDSREALLLTAVLAPKADERFREIYRLFQGRSEPTMAFLLGLLEPDGLGRFENTGLLGWDGTLLSHGLIETVGECFAPGPDTAFQPAPGLLEWLNGTLRMDIWHGRAEWSTGPEEDEVSEDEFPDMDEIRMAVEMAEISHEPIPMISFFGPDSERLLNAAEMLCAQMERPCLKLNLRGLEPGDVLKLTRLALRDCVLNEGVLTLSGLSDSGDGLLSRLEKLLDSWNVPVILISERDFVFPPEEFTEGRLLLRVPIAGLTGTQRLRVWKRRLANLPPDDSLDEEALRVLAGQFSLNSSQIRAAVRTGLGIAVTEGRDLSIKDLYEGARQSSMHHLSNLAQKMPQRYTLKDLILPEKQMGEIEKLIAMAKNRSLVLEDWGLGKKLVSGQGISALFTGVPGTGKTLSAQVIAGELGLDLYRVDLSTIISKYIGETEKNLEKIFSEARNSNVVLFFDEADALFGRRSEVSDSHDRYANIEVSYLLQRIETYDGIVLMATNLGANLDEAFVRRIHFIIDFPFPDEETRLRLWELLLPENVEKDEDIDLTMFAGYKIAGGNIRNAVVWAVYDAARNKRPLCALDLHRGVEREYQKMGKVIPYSFNS